MPQDRTYAVNTLRKAFLEGKLTLYLGAGVSRDSLIPNWKELVLSLYYKIKNEELRERSWRPFPNYLYAISEYLIDHSDEPLDIIVRRLKLHFDKNQEAILPEIKNVLYGKFFSQDTYHIPDNITRFNKTLGSIADICQNSSYRDKKGVNQIITYNFDNLLEIALNQRSCGDSFKAIWRHQQKVTNGNIPIFHVHGYLPLDNHEFRRKHCSTTNELVLSEETYNEIAQNAFYWGNVIQMSSLVGNVGLMIGLSLTDRNIRRLLDAIKRLPRRTEKFIILPRPKRRMAEEMTAKDFEQIHGLAHDYKKHCEELGIPFAETKGNFEIRRMMDKLFALEHDEITDMVEDLGVTPIWIEESFQEEIPRLFNEIQGKT